MAHFSAMIVAEQGFCEFYKPWMSGLQPSLKLQTHPNGDIFVSSTVTTVFPHQQSEEAAQHSEHAQHQQRRVGPSRL